MADWLPIGSVCLRVDAPRGWRQLVGAALQRLAARIDGRWFVAIEIAGDPPLARDRQVAVLRAGFEHAYRLLVDEGCAAAVERALRAARPELYAE